jgi:hypothetical protein
VSKHNRERKQLWKLGLHKKQIGRKATASQIFCAKQKAIRAKLERDHAKMIGHTP